MNLTNPTLSLLNSTQAGEWRHDDILWRYRLRTADERRVNYSG